MRIISSDTKLGELTLRLRSTDRRFNWLIRSTFDPVLSMNPEDKDGSAYIEFDDSHEIDQLINILQRFKEENLRYFGEWV